MASEVRWGRAGIKGDPVRPLNLLRAFPSRARSDGNVHVQRSGPVGKSRGEGDNSVDLIP